MSFLEQFKGSEIFLRRHFNWLRTAVSILLPLIEPVLLVRTWLACPALPDLRPRRTGPAPELPVCEVTGEEAYCVCKDKTSLLRGLYEVQEPISAHRCGTSKQSPRALGAKSTHNCPWRPGKAPRAKWRNKNLRLITYSLPFFNPQKITLGRTQTASP